MSSHLGIELRVSLNGSVILQGNSVHLHMIAKLAGGDGWYDPFNPPNGPQTVTQVTSDSGPVFVPVPLTIELRAVELADPLDDDETEAGDAADDSEDQEA